MIERLTNRIIEYQIKTGSIDIADSNVYRYGYILLFEVIINICIAFAISFTFRTIKEMFFFLIFFMMLRSFCGGYHADKIWHCVVISNIVMIFAIHISKFAAKYSIPIILYIVIEMCFSLIIYYNSPVDNKNKRLSNAEKTIYKKYIFMIIIIENIFGFVLMVLEKYKYAYIILCIFLIQFISILVQKINNRGDDNLCD